MKLTTENMAALVAWQEDGRRSFEVRKDCLTCMLWEKEPIRVWVYDYDIQAGETIKEISELPTKEALLKKANASLAEKKAELEERLKSLEA